MARRVIGLDVGTNAVRVADVEIGEEITLRAFGQVALPLDAMREGEVLDPDAVTAAIQRLWRELGLKKGEVRVGIAGPRVIVRTVDMPVMPDTELASAIRFQAGELIPIPLDDAVLDFQVLETLSGEPEAGVPAPPPVADTPAPPAAAGGLPPIPSSIPSPGEQGAPEPVSTALDDQTLPLPTAAPAAGTGTNRVLVAAAHKETVQRLVASVRDAGLKVAAVDLVPLALVRALGRRVAVDGPGAEGLVCVGGGVTVVVVHENGLPRFVRMLGTGGRGLTDAIARDLELTPETAEALKRQGASSPPELAPRVATALERPVADLLEEIRGSLDYWRTQPGSVRLAHVTLTGGGSLQPGLAEGLNRLLAVPVDRARPREDLHVGDIGFPPDEVEALDPYLPVPIGLALGGAPAGKRINLVGGERVTAPADTRKLALVGAAIGVALLLLLGFLTLQENRQLDDAQDDLATQTARNTRTQTQIDQLSEAQANQTQIDTVAAQVTQVLESDVSWAVMLQEIARTIPDDSWLTAFQGAVTADAAGSSAAADTAAGLSGSTDTTPTTATTAPDGTATTPTPPPSTITGTVSFTAVGLDFTSIAGWLQRVSAIPSYADLWVPSATSTELGGRTVVNFTSNAALTDAAKSDRADEFSRGAR